MNKKTFSNIILAIGLISLFAFIGWNIYQNHFAKKKSAEIKILPETVRAAGSSVEIAETEDGQQVATFLSYPKYYKDEGKVWQPVETDIVKNEAGDIKLPSGAKADWKVDKGVWKFYATDEGAVAFDNGGSKLETQLKSLVYLDPETGKIATIYSMEPQSVVAPVVAGNQIIWPNIIDGVDYKITYINDMLKEDLILSAEVRKNLPTPESLGIPSERARLGFVFDANKSWFQDIEYYVTEEKGKISAKTKTGEDPAEMIESSGPIGLADAEGEVRQTIESGFATLADQQPTTNNQQLTEKNLQPTTQNLQPENRLPLLKRFQFDKENRKRIYFSGSKYADIQNLGEGDLLFDPTVSFQDTSQNPTSANFSVDHSFSNYSGVSNLEVGYISACSPYSTDNYCRSLIRFPNFSGSGLGQVPGSATVVKAYLSLYHYINVHSTTVDAYKMLDQWNSNEFGSSYAATYYDASNTGGDSNKCVNEVAGITSSQTSFTADNCSGSPLTPSVYPDQGLLKIDNEIMWYTAHDSTSFSGLIRGVSGTTAATHADNATLDTQITWVESGGSVGPLGNSVGSLLDSASLSSLGWKKLDVTSAAQDWVNNPNSNNGVLLRRSSGAEEALSYLYSSESVNPIYRPTLVVAYTTGESGQAGLVNAYESADTAVSPSSPGTATTAQNFAYATEAEDSGFWTTALSATDNGYDSQVFKMQVPSASATVPITVNWKGHGESAASNNNVALNIWNFNSSAWEELDSGDARYNDDFTNRTSELNAATSWPGTTPVNATTFDSANNMIYLAGGLSLCSGRKFAKYNPSSDSFTDLTTGTNCGFNALAYDSANKEIYLGEHNGSFEKYNPITNSLTYLADKISSFWSTNSIYALVFDSARNIIYLGGVGGKFAKYDPATGIATDLTSALNTATSWSTNNVNALAFDSANEVIYLGGGYGKFAKYDPATDIATNLTSKISSFWSTGVVQSITFDSGSNVIYLSGTAANTFARYTPAVDVGEDLGAYITPTKTALYSSAFDPANQTIYFLGNYSRVHRFFPASLSSQNMSNSVYDAFAGSFTLNASTFDTTNKVLYIGGASGKFGKYAVSGNTTLSGTVSSNIQNYRDSSGYAWLWVKAANEWSPPSVTGVSSGVNPVTWTSGEGADGAVAYHVNVSHSGGSWSDYPNVAYEADAGWKNSHSVTIPTGVCGDRFYYRVRSCDQWGSCTVSAEDFYDSPNCGGSCPFLFSWDGEKYDFQTDIISSGKMGLPAGKDGRRKPNADDYYFLKEETLEDEGGRYKFKLTEERDEMDYLDNLKLYYVDHAPNLEVYTDQIRIGQERKGLAPAIYTVDKTALKKPVSCTDYYGNDCLEKITVSDNDYTAPGQLYRWDTMEMDLGDLRDSENIKLVLRSFQAVAGTFENQPAYDKNIHGPMPDVSFKLEVKNEKGEWQNIDVKNLSLSPTEFPRTYVADLTGIFLTDDYRMRLSYYNDTRFDYVAIDTSENIPVELREVELERAELGNRLAVSKKNMEIGPYKPQYEQEIKDKKNLAFSGNFTKYGDVKELLDSKDDKFLIFQKPDELDVEFRSAPNLSEGLERDFMLYSSGFYKVAKYGIAPTVDPLPFNAMSNYPYPEGEYPYKDDADYQDYLDTWNTRRIEKGQKAKDFDGTLPGQLDKIFEKGKELLDNLISKSDFDISGEKVVGEYTMHAENSNGSADTDFIEMSVDSNVRLKGGVTLPGGVRLK